GGKADESACGGEQARRQEKVPWPGARQPQREAGPRAAASSNEQERERTETSQRDDEADRGEQLDAQYPPPAPAEPELLPNPPKRLVDSSLAPVLPLTDR